MLAVLELNALGKISGRGNTGLNVIYETHKNAMYTGFGLIVVFYILAEIILRGLTPAGAYTPSRSAMWARCVLLDPNSGSSDLARFT